MTDNLTILDSPDEHEKGFVPDLVWLLKGFVFPCWSREFYKKAAKKRVYVAVLFFFLFALIQTSIAAIQIIATMNSVGNEIKGAYERGEFPTITIEDGIASTDGYKPYIFSENRSLLAIDTTGNTQEIDMTAYSEGMLLTRTEIHLLSDKGYQVYPLTDFHESFGNPIVIDETQILDLWGKVALGINLAATIGLFIWNSLVRLAYITLIGLFVWGGVSINRQGVGFDLILITGIYANVPTLYIIFALKKIGISFLSLYTILLIIIWIITLRIVLKARDNDSAIVDSKAVIL